MLAIICMYIQYLGSIPGITDWQSPDSRSDFLEMVDEGQVRMHVSNAYDCSEYLIYALLCFIIINKLLGQILIFSTGTFPICRSLQINYT